MKIKLFGIVGLFTLAMMNAAVVFAQDETIRSAAGDKYVISAKAGGVNYVEGTVGVVRKAGKSGYLLKGDTLRIGDRVSTGANGKAEILLNPGSYLRLGGSSAFEFVTTSLEDLQIRLDSGSAILEVFADNDFRVTLRSPKSEFSLIESGIYRLDVAANGGGKLEVWKGRAEVGDTTAKGGRIVTAFASNVTVEKFDRDQKDELEIWSKARAKELAKASETLQRRQLRTSLMRSFLGGRWNMYNSFGLWVYDASFGRYCFLPFGYGWNSPYGYGFGHNIWTYQLPPVVYYPPTTGGTTPSPGPGPVITLEDRTRRPPFAHMQGSGSSTGRDSGGEIRGGGRGSTFDPSPTRGDTEPAPIIRSVPSSPPIIDMGGSSDRKKP